MTSHKVIIITISLIIFLIISLFILSKYNYISNINTYSIYLAILFTTINFSLGIGAIKIGFKRNNKVFMASIFGGMLIGFISLIILVFIALKFLDISRNIFIFLVLFFYILYLISEIFYLILLDKEQKQIND